MNSLRGWAVNRRVPVSKRMTLYRSPRWVKRKHTHKCSTRLQIGNVYPPSENLWWELCESGCVPLSSVADCLAIIVSPTALSSNLKAPPWCDRAEPLRWPWLCFVFPLIHHASTQWTGVVRGACWDAMLPWPVVLNQCITWGRTVRLGNTYFGRCKC